LPHSEDVRLTAPSAAGLSKVSSHPAAWLPFTVAIAAVSILLQSGCASPGVSTTQAVRVETPDCDMALCDLSNDKGRWTVTSTPGTVTITTSSQPLEIACRAPGEGSPSVPARAPSAVDERGKSGTVMGGAVGAGAAAAFVAPLTLVPPFTALAVIFVGAAAAAGAGAGAVVDETSRHLRYPETIAVPLVCQSVAPLPSQLAAARIGIAIRGLTDSEAMTAGLPGRGAVIVTRLGAYSRAAQAGLREGDIILRCNDIEVGDAGQFQAVVLGTAPDQPLRLRVLREGQSLEVALPQRVALP
jgi:hypothetical protein